MTLPRICIASPIKESAPALSVWSLMQFTISYMRRGGIVDYRISTLASNLAQARNELLAVMLKSPADKFIFLDADVTFTVEDVDKLLSLDLGEDIVSAMFKKRIMGSNWIGQDTGEPNRGSLIPMARIGFGMVVVQRSCLEKLVAKYGAGLFEFRFDGKEIVGEDYLFCDRWREMGGKIWAHTGVQLGHVGPHEFK